jgi:hypothetical protein
VTVRKGKRRVSRWLFGYETRPPVGVRLAFCLATLVLLGGTYAATKSEELQILVLYALALGMFPALARRVARGDPYWEIASERNVPFGVLAVSFAFGIPWAALLHVVVPAELGPWFWWWAVIWPWLEVFGYLAERRLERDGPDAWKPIQPRRDSALAGALTAPLTLGIMLVQGVPVAEAVPTSAACGVIVFAISSAIIWSMRRGRTPPPTCRTESPSASRSRPA